jgi:hypothetical protein
LRRCCFSNFITHQQLNLPLKKAKTKHNKTSNFSSWLFLFGF